MEGGLGLCVLLELPAGTVPSWGLACAWGMRQAGALEVRQAIRWARRCCEGLVRELHECGCRLSRQAQGPDPGRRGHQACEDREKQGSCPCPSPPTPSRNLLEACSNCRYPGPTPRESDSALGEATHRLTTAWGTRTA